MSSGWSPLPLSPFPVQLHNPCYDIPPFQIPALQDVTTFPTLAHPTSHHPETANHQDREGHTQGPLRFSNSWCINTQQNHLSTQKFHCNYSVGAHQPRTKKIMQDINTESMVSDLEGLPAW